MVLIMVLCVLSLPYLLSVAFDAPGSTWSDVLPSLLTLYAWILSTWFVIGFVFNILRPSKKERRS